MDNIFDVFSYLENLNIQKVHGKGKRKSKEQILLEKTESHIERFEKYTNYLEILGERNSFSKTDNDATFMRMKEDYMRNGQLKPGYNLQIGVISEYIASYEIFHNPSDSKTLIPFLEKIKSQNIEIINVVADAGYESLPNYEYLENNNYVSYIKPIYYEKSKTRKYKKDLNRVENLEYNEEENRLFRKDGLELEFLYYGKDKKTIYFRNPETEKKVRYNYEFRKLSKESKDNIESEFDEFTLNSTYKSDVVDRGSVFFLKGTSEYSDIIPAGTRIEVVNLSDLVGVLNLSIKAKSKDNEDILNYKLYIEDRESRAYTFAQPTLKKRIGEKIYVIFDKDVKKNSCRVDYYLYR